MQVQNLRHILKESSLTGHRKDADIALSHIQLHSFLKPIRGLLRNVSYFTSISAVMVLYLSARWAIVHIAFGAEFWACRHHLHYFSQYFACRQNLFLVNFPRIKLTSANQV